MAEQNKNPVEYKAKIVRIGNSFGVVIPKDFIKHNLVNKDKRVLVTLTGLGDVFKFGYDTFTTHWSNTPVNALT